MPQMSQRKRLRTAAIATAFGCLGIVVLFFGSAFVSALYETIVTLREEGAETTRATSSSPVAENADRADTASTTRPTNVWGSRLDMDVQVSEQGVLTVTETLSMPQLEKALPGEGGYTRTLYKYGRDDSRSDSADYPARAFDLDIVDATCDGVSVPYYVHDSKAVVRFCVDPPNNADPKAPHEYRITYKTTKDLYYPVWTRFQRLVYTALYNDYNIPIDEVRVRIEFPEGVELSRKRIDGWTGRGYMDHWRDLQGWDGNTDDYEVALDAPNVVSLRTTTPLYATETFVFRVYFPKGSVDGPLNVGVVMDFVFGCIVIGLVAFIPGSILYVSFTQSRERAEDSPTEAESPADPAMSAEPSENGEVVAPKEVSPAPAEQSQKPRSRAKTTLVFISSLFIMIFGGLIVYEVTIYPLMKWQEGKSWQETPCRIVDLGRTLRYDYEWDGHTYSSGQYDLGPFGWGLRESFQKIKRETPIGSETVCYVNPADPHQAVLSKKLKSGYFFGLGAGGLIFLVGLALLGKAVSMTGD